MTSPAGAPERAAGDAALPICTEHQREIGFCGTCLADHVARETTRYKKLVPTDPTHEDCAVVLRTGLIALDNYIHGLRADLATLQAERAVPTPMWRSDPDGQITLVECEQCAALKAGARAWAVEECLTIIATQPFYPDTHTGTRQQWIKDQITNKLKERVGDD